MPRDELSAAKSRLKRQLLYLQLTLESYDLKPFPEILKTVDQAQHLIEDAIAALNSMERLSDSLPPHKSFAKKV